jgi:citrate lyase subunit beta/citryl-CoA lyase
MQNRSWLLVPADSDKKLSIAAATGADNVVVDLERGIKPDFRGQARIRAANWLDAQRQREGGRGCGRWVRINAFDGGEWHDDLVAVLPYAPDGIVLPRSAGPDMIRQVAAELYELEQRCGAVPGATRIIPIVGETPQSAMTIFSYVAEAPPRLAGLTWTIDGLGDAIGATRRRDAGGRLTETFRYLRSQTLLTAHGCSIMALDAPMPGVGEEEALNSAALGSRADGFTGMFATHPAQIRAINAAFAEVHPASETPTESAAPELAPAVARIGPGSGREPILRRA